MVDLESCNSNENGTLYKLYCPHGSNDTEIAKNPSCYYFTKHPPHTMDGIPGLASGVFISEYSALSLEFKLYRNLLVCIYKCVIRLQHYKDCRATIICNPFLIHGWEIGVTVY